MLQLTVHKDTEERYLGEIEETTSKSKEICAKLKEVEISQIRKKKSVNVAIQQSRTKNEDVLEKEDSREIGVKEALQKIRSLNQAISKNIESMRTRKEITCDKEPSEYDCRNTTEEFGEMKPDITNVMDEEKGSALSMEKEESIENCILSIQRHIAQ